MKLSERQNAIIFFSGAVLFLVLIHLSYQPITQYIDSRVHPLVKVGALIGFFLVFIFILAISSIVQAGGSTQGVKSKYFKEIEFTPSPKGAAKLIIFVLQIFAFSLVSYFVMGIFF